MEKLMLALSLLTFNILLSFSSKHTKKMLHITQEEQYDGPYVQYRNGQVLAQYIMQANGTKKVRTDSVSLEQKAGLSLTIMTDIPGKIFRVQLKQQFQVQKSEYHKVSKLFVLSDIEGNFDAFRKLLQAGKVIDENFNWTFGNGHLVLIGDFFDRGQQVTELLWLIYYLEDKAKAAGGYVHFILGNHEIMNLTGDVRYTPAKYLDNAALLNEKYMTLYNEDSELGRWLRTKNIVEKIGDIVFTHGGISGYVNSLNTSIPEINNLARPYYADTLFNYTDERSDILMGDLGPFWYRGYYDPNNRNISSQIDSTLYQFRARHIITGHTIVSDTISVWYNGKLLNTDVHHAEGKSEALLIDDNKYFRVNQQGDKVLLMEGHKR